MNRVIVGAPSSFGHFFGFTPKKPASAAKAKARPAQSRPTATKIATSTPAPRPADFSHLLKASRAHDAYQVAPTPMTPKPRTLGEQINALHRQMGRVAHDQVDPGPEQPKREQPRRRRDGASTLGDQVAALQKKFGVA
ncbi:MAG: hypothetical protein ACRYHQ_28370 [Janthinobacterium lividum]